MGPLRSRAGWPERGGLSGQGTRPPTEPRGHQECLQATVRGRFPKLLLWVGDTRAAQPEKELLSVSLPPLTPTHSDGLFVVTSAASGGPWEGCAARRAGAAALGSALVALRVTAGDALCPVCQDWSLFHLFVFSLEGPTGLPVCPVLGPFLPQSLWSPASWPGAIHLVFPCPAIIEATEKPCGDFLRAVG